MAFYQFEREQFIPTTLETLWDFIATPRNLKKITPDFMGFDITSSIKDRMYQGMIISYVVKPFKGIKTKWVTEITHLKELSYFVDEQRIGPYSLWHHQHILIPKEDGVLMKDIITYEPPYGILGAIANSLFIEKKLTSIFDYRQTVLEEYFPLKK